VEFVLLCILGFRSVLLEFLVLGGGYVLWITGPDRSLIVD